MEALLLIFVAPFLLILVLVIMAGLVKLFAPPLSNGPELEDEVQTIYTFEVEHLP